MQHYNAKYRVIMPSPQLHVCGDGGNPNCYPGAELAVAGGSRSRRRGVRRGGGGRHMNQIQGGSRSRGRKTARRSRRGGRGGALGYMVYAFAGGSRSRRVRRGGIIYDAPRFDIWSMQRFK